MICLRSLLAVTGIFFSLLGIASGALGPNDPVVVGQTFLAGSLDPTVDSTSWSLISHGIAEKLFTVDENGEILGQLAESATRVSELVWDIKLASGRFFSDGTEVDASHVATSLTLQNTENEAAQATLGAMTVTVVDDSTVRIQSQRPTHIMDSVLANWVFAIYFKVTEEQFVFTGPFVPENFGETQIDLVPNTFFPQAEERPNVQLKKFATGDELADAVKRMEVDIGFHLPIHTLDEVRDVEGIRVKSFEVGYHYMVFYNIDTLSDVRVRTAIDLAIDRIILSQALAGGKATRSLFPDNSPFYTDESDPHGDPTEAARLLDEAGWVLDASSGKRVKDNQVLTIRLVAYPHRPGLGIMQPEIAEALEDLGIEVTQIMTGMDWTETSTIMEDRTFDMLMWAQHTLPSGDSAFFLNNFFRSDGGSNHANLNSSTVDNLLDQLSTADDHDQRVLLTAAVQEAIHNEVPVSNLVTPYWHVSLSDRVADYVPWGSDYYVIRADLRLTQEPIESSSVSVSVIGATMTWMMGMSLVFVVW